MKKQRLRQSHFNPLQGQANMIQQQEATQQQTAYALQALADATSEDCTDIANLTHANKQLTDHLDTMSS